jgi:predicted esterase
MLVAVAACSGGKRFRVALSGIDGRCAADGDCRAPLVCTNATCQPGGNVPEGGDCIVSGDCDGGLYCARGTCAPAGDRAEGEVCTWTSECESGLVCALQGLVGVCSGGGSQDLGERCASAADCVPAMVCDPVAEVCAVDYPAPAGEVCTNPGECNPDLGFHCLGDPANPDQSRCGGLGPDGAPVPGWSGIACPGEEEGTFRVLFEVDNTSNDFFRLPFPNDIRIDADGTVDLTGFPEPPSSAVPVDLVGRYVDAIEAEQKGFGPNQTVFFRTSRWPLFCALGCADSATPPCEAGCMGQGEPAPSVYAVDLGAVDGPTYAECAALAEGECLTTDGCSWQASGCTWTRSFKGQAWQASTGDSRYICGPWIAVTPTFSAPWRANHTYAVILHRDVIGNDGQSQEQDADFAAMLADAAPGGSLQAAWEAYQPLRDWLCPDPPTCAGAPTYSGASDPRSGETVVAAHLGAAAVFTVRDPTLTLTALGDQVESTTIAATSAVDCTDPTVLPCYDTTGRPFVELQGEIDLPIFQAGDAPYLSSGGGVADPPVESGRESVRFSLSVPRSARPADGWPVVVYAHGTGGSYQSHLADGTAALFATATVPAAVLGIDQVAHGPRAGGSSLGPDLLFFNFGNPRAARGNVLQSAADQLSLLVAVGAVGTAVGESLDAGKLVFLGHSQGSTSGALAMARSSLTGAVVLSGAGGGLMTSLGQKRSPYDLPSVVRLAIADPFLGEFWIHPTISLLQGYLEDADPVNYGRHIAVEPLTGSAAKHSLHVIGVDDTYTPNDTSRHLARRMSASFVAPVGFVASAETVSPPVAGNRASGTLTVVATVHEPEAANDGHFVLFEVAGAADRVAAFVSDFLADPASAPTVVP